jgi:hypothetical protein
MSQQLIDRSNDLRRLRDAGYDLSVRGGYVVVATIPYVTAQKTVGYGSLVMELTAAGDIAMRPSTHVAYFVGEYPCNVDGTPIEQIRHSGTTDLGGGLVANFSFSNKPAAGYTDYFEKITRYVEIISGPAQAIDSQATPHVLPVLVPDDDASSFHYVDTASSRAGIGAVTDKLKAISSVFIVGAGGTGSYVLDLVAKTPVREIHVYDGDYLLTHNAFRSPGAPTLEELRARPLKVEHLAAIYSRMHRRIVPHGSHVGPEQLHELDLAGFVFVCIDDGPAKKLIVEHLLSAHIPFIDVGMGVNLVEGSLGGILRSTLVCPANSSHVDARISFGDADVNNDYAENIQVADLNALNASLAVIKWKKWAGFYRDLGREHNCCFAIDTNTLINEDVS